MLLFTPGYIGTLKIKNRLVMAPLSTNFPSAEGEVTPEFTAFYTARARGGAGLIILESTDVDDPLGKCGYTELRIDEDRFMPGLYQLVDQIHEAGAKAAIQLNHSGGMFGDRDRSEFAPVAASAMVYGKNKKIAREASIDEIHRLQEKFVSAAERAQKVGFDAVELHGAHGYLMASFLSPWTNVRTDEYGGNVENRARFAIEIIRSIRRCVGNRFPLIFRISGDEFVKGGRHLEETIELVKLLKEAGIDCVDVSAGTHRFPQLEARRAQVEPMSYPQAWKTYLAREIGKNCNITTIAVGTIRDVDVAERVVQEDADFVAMARSWIADPDWGVKAMQGQPIRHCINCNGCILFRSYYAGKLRCCVNPMTGREFRLTPPEQLPQTDNIPLAVVGGGPAGMEAARVAAIRGRKVTLFEKTDRLGGNLVPAGAIDLKNKIHWLPEWQEQQLHALHVEIRLGTEATANLLEEEGFRQVIVAVGGKSRELPKMRIAPDARVKIVEALDLLNGTVQLSDTEKPVFVAGSGLVGLETAYFLAKQGKKVVVLSRSRNKQTLMNIADPQNMAELLVGLARSGVRIWDHVQYIALEKDKLLCEHNGQMLELSYSWFVSAQGFTGDTALAEVLEARGFDVRSAGDCVSVRTALPAMSEGFMAGYYI